jgi:hypothetical protein
MGDEGQMTTWSSAFGSRAAAGVPPYLFSDVTARVAQTSQSAVSQCFQACGHDTRSDVRELAMRDRLELGDTTAGRETCAKHVRAA